MTFKSPTQPHCRYCGKGIAKKTSPHWVEHASFRDSPYGQDRVFCDAPPTSKADVQRLVNARVVSVGYHDQWRRYDPLTKHSVVEKTVRYINYFTTWDGESWQDQFFCNGDHAKRFGYVMAYAGHCTKAYNNAVAKKESA